MVSLKVCFWTFNYTKFTYRGILVRRMKIRLTDIQEFIAIMRLAWFCPIRRPGFRAVIEC